MKKTPRKEAVAVAGKVAPRAPAPLARPSSEPAPGAQSKPAAKPVPRGEQAEIVGNEEWAGAEHRRFPRAKLCVPFVLLIGDDGDVRFSASLPSYNVSVSGAFLDSSYYLPVGTNLHVSFTPAEGAPPVQARAEIVRQERAGDRPGYNRDGFAVRFTEFFHQSEVTLAHLFLGLKLRAFATDYLQSKRARSLTGELDRVVDALAAWELRKVVNAEDIWHMAEP